MLRVLVSHHVGYCVVDLCDSSPEQLRRVPAVIAEGRRVIANIERTANLFITKTVYVFELALAIGIAQAPFSFLPRHLTLVGFLIVGAPGLFLSFARKHDGGAAGLYLPGGLPSPLAP